MNESFFNADGSLKSAEDILRIHEEAQWKLISEQIDRSHGYMRAIRFNDTGSVCKKNRKKLEAAGFTVYDATNGFHILFNEAAALQKK